MSEPVKPIKRSKELAPLSREHHEGLLFVWKIRRGCHLKIENKRIYQFISWFWDADLKAHFFKEEEILAHVCPPDSELLQQMLAEHKNIRRQVEELSESSDYAAFEILASSVNDHIRFEERQLFPAIENAATKAQLLQVGESLETVASCALQWNDPFWVNNPR